MRGHLAVVAIAATLTTAGCGSDEECTFAAEPAVVDHDTPGSPQELVAWSDAVVAGTVVDVQEGRVERSPSADPEYCTPHLTATVSGRDVGADGVLTGPERTIHVELMRLPNVSVADYRRHLPPDLDVLVFARLDTGERDELYVDPDAGRPGGEPIHHPTVPPSFVVGPDAAVRTDDGKVDLPDVEATAGASLEDFLPDEVRSARDPDAPPRLP